MSRFTIVLALSISLLLIGLYACGYQLAGTGGLPGGIQTLHVQVVANSSSETGTETLVTNALISELNRRRQGVVVEADAAEAVLTGAIDALTWDTVSLRGLTTAAERRVYLTLSLSLVATNGDVLWKRSGLRAEQAYAVVEGNKPATENNRRSAIREVSLRLAEDVYRRMTDQF